MPCPERIGRTGNSLNVSTYANDQFGTRPAALPPLVPSQAGGTAQ
jgi:hypothetical protein